MTPSLKNVAAALMILCKNNDVFTPTMVRRLLGVNFPETESTQLSSQIQPHLRAMRQAGIITLIQPHKKRNRPHKLLNRTTLAEISQCDNYFLPENINNNFTNDDDDDNDAEPADQNQITNDETTNLVIEMERRMLELEERVNELFEKLSAASVVFRK